jgi:site-specific DNA-methyltransferase (adenine-specific)
MNNLFTLHLGDCLESLRGMADNSIDAVISDPPYGLSQHTPEQVLECLKAWLAGEVYVPKGKGFMGKSWDAWVPGPEVWRECLRVLKPGGHVLAFAGTRSMDLMSMAIRLAGFELRDAVGYAHDGGGAPLLAYCYGSGFPKSHDVSKAIDKAAGVEREVVGVRERQGATRGASGRYQWNGEDAQQEKDDVPITAPATEAARQWQGWGTALKPAWEPIILARKPLIGTVAENVLEHGTGGLNIDGCRIESERIATTNGGANEIYGDLTCNAGTLWTSHDKGRWPANLIHDGSDEVVGAFPQAKGQQGSVTGEEPSSKTNAVYGQFNGRPAATPRGDKGSAARFFYAAKASRADRNEGLRSGDTPAVAMHATMGDLERADWASRNGNHHPTVKPTDLMAYLCRLVTPPGGVVLDPFMGSGSTGKAAIREGFQFIGCEMSPEYMDIARARIQHEVDKIDAARVVTPQPDLFA